MESEAELLQCGAVSSLVEDQVINGGIQKNSLRKAALMVTFWNILPVGMAGTKKEICLGRVREMIYLMGSLW